MITLRNLRTIQKARPYLQLVSPLTFWICIGFAMLNYALGYVIYTVADVSDLAVYKIFDQQLMGGLFALLATAQLLALVLNAWQLTRITLGCGLLVKAFYAYSLVELGIRVGFANINGVLALWFFLVWVQFATIVFFLPPNTNGRLNVTSNR